MLTPTRKVTKRGFIDENEYEVDKEYNIKQEESSVKNLEKWEQRNKENALNLYALNLTMKLQNKILKNEGIIPSININNINAINYDLDKICKEEEQKDTKTWHTSKTKASMRKLMMNKVNSMQKIRSNNLLLRDPSVKYSQSDMLREERANSKVAQQEDLLSMFKISDTLSLKEKKKIEEEMHEEYQRLKNRLSQVKDSLKLVFADNNERYHQISHASENMAVLFISYFNLFIA